MRQHEIGSDGTLFTVLIDGDEDFVSPVILIAAPDAQSGAGAVSVTTYLTELTSGSTDAWTLADGAVKGQLKKVIFVSDGGDSTLTLTSAVSASLNVITFTAIGDTAVLVWTGSAWAHLELSNIAGTSATPTIA